MTNLAQAQTSAQSLLQSLNTNPNLDDILGTAFGSDYDPLLANNILTQWQSGNFANLPTVTILSATNMNGAVGAYSSESNQVFLSDSFVNSASVSQIEKVLIEEYGHYLDSQINDTDSLGDEGEIFALLASGNNISSEVLANLYSENDHAVIEIDGQQIEVEQAITIPISGELPADDPVGIEINFNGTFTLPFTSYVASINSTQQLIGVSADLFTMGVVSFLDNNGNILSNWFDLRQLNINTNNVFDITTGQFRNFSGSIFPQSSTYGDIAVLERGNRLDILVAGKSDITPFIVTKNIVKYNID